MTIEIAYDRTSGLYTITADGATLGHTETYHAAAETEASYLEAKASATMGGDPLLMDVAQIKGCSYRGCVQNRTHEDTGFCRYHQSVSGNWCNCDDDDYADAVWESDQGSYNGFVPFLRHSGLPNPLARVQAAYSASSSNICQGCGRTSLSYYCDDCEIIGQIEERRLDQQPEWLDVEGMRVTPPWVADNTPLLAQCAAVLDACLGGPVIGGGILDELRRVRAELAQEGW